MVFKSSFVNLLLGCLPINFTPFYNQIYVSFSGGKDSTVLLHLVRRLYPDTPAVFVDTGLEYPELREFVKSVENVTWVRPEMNFKTVIQTYGYPIVSKEVSLKIAETRSKPDGYASQSFNSNSPKILKYGKRYDLSKWKFLLEAPFLISNKCCNVMKKKPAKRYEKETGNHPIIGTMACESQARKTAWKIHGCNAFDTKRPTSQPLSFWTEQDILEYIKKYNLSYAPVYGEIIQDDKGKWQTTKCNRTGCVFCMYGCHLEKEPNRFQSLKITHPKLWQYCMKPMSEGGLGLKEVLEFIGVKIE
jgi:3'-phosphoadenosine 5'-phosphosulfate sulfotransferase (PAPS reductase)/FAD synthetase